MFPFADETFDVVFALSVFTHLLPESAINYAKEIARVLKHGGRAFLTFYLMNEAWRYRVAGGQLLAAEFPYKCERYSVADIHNPEAVVAYEEKDAIKFFVDAGLQLNELSLGRWSNNDGWTHQDAILAGKP